MTTRSKKTTSQTKTKKSVKGLLNEVKLDTQTHVLEDGEIWTYPEHYEKVDKELCDKEQVYRAQITVKPDGPIHILPKKVNKTGEKVYNDLFSTDHGKMRESANTYNFNFTFPKKEYNGQMSCERLNMELNGMYRMVKEEALNGE